ncbi:nitrate reductase molybdenum cofactor assembly chaperone [Aliidiomarina taiwanensis]|uniref:Nitrate reductase molybdenum cofactor assembly chaperone n=1 Tax=Aliidiomarina taiwanensis TaxID=946228 RepID=A0A432X7G7_9GAMM|nr:nitrate reductase molybdenum cofactor assembly chaperone [Aliidiomarina taiwanensis]RUO42737.1 nitrate reductase molybdenum cofactor assembly chaperone [Aliidiomarina taiwanensis]
MKIAQVISLLLDYPTDDLLEAKQPIVEIISASQLAPEQKEAMLEFVESRFNGDLMDWQAEYNGLFERGRSLSLLLFEHIHGESRDRGQAMVNLLKQYKEAGLEIGVRELPDYLPLYLEFLSTQGDENLVLGLQEVAHVLATLSARLEQRESNYAALTNSLLNLSGVQVDMADIHSQIANEERDDTSEALDKVWEEEMVTFGPDSSNDGCSSGTSKPSESQRKDQYVPIQWADELLKSSELAEKRGN